MLLALPFVLPLLGAAVSLATRRRPGVLRVLCPVVLAGALAAAVAIVVAVADEGVRTLRVGGWAPPLGITLVGDRLSALLVLVSAGVLLAILIYEIGEDASGLSESEPVVFYPVYLVLSAGVFLVFLTGDLFTMFVGFEIMLASSYVLITLSPTPARVRAGITYTVVSLTASILFLLTIALTYAATATVNLADLATRTPDLPAGLRGALGSLFVIVFGVKAAIVPLHLWLPDSYPTALTKITAILAALLTKVGVYALIRTQTLLFPDGRAAPLLLALAAATMLVGTMGALVQDDLHRVLSFALVGHIGYMVLGLALFSIAGLAGAVYYLVHHIVVQATLFLVSDVMQRRTGEISLRRLGGLARASRLTAVLFFVPALSLSGIPPLSGFVAKLALVQAGIAAGRPADLLVTGVALAAGLITLAAMGRVWVKAFWRPRPDTGDRRPNTGPPAHPGGRGLRLMSGVTLTLVGGGVLLAVLAGPLLAWSGHAAGQLIDRTAYVHAVLGRRAAP